jgi:GT2 family glycosyltransferase
MVAVVVLTWNGREDTLACLRSLARVAAPPQRVIVVDNASTDGTAAAVASEFPDVELLRLDENRGYAGGMNAGLERALATTADHVLVLNNDVEVDPGFLSALVAEAGRRPDAGVLCPLVLFADAPDLVWYGGARFDPTRGYNGRITGYRQPSERFVTVQETDRAAGTAMLIPRPALERVGMFDESLFAYSEDTDWSLRARALGYRLLVVPASRVWHKVSPASGGENAPATLYYGLRNTLAVCERHAPLGRFGTWRRRLVLVAVHLLQALRSRERLSAVRAVAQGWRDWRRGRFGPR